MSLRRKAIREGIKALLDGNTDAGSNVYTNLASSSWQENLPAIVIYPRSETVEDLDVAPKQYRRLLLVTVEIIAIGPEDPNTGDASTPVQDVLDTIGEQVEDWMSRDDSIGAYTDAFGNQCRLAERVDLQNVEYEFEGEGLKPIGSLRLNFQVMYSESRPLDVSLQTDVANIADLNQIHIDYSVGHHDSPPDAIDEATDDIDLT